jgi:hypothetical protein
MSEVVLFWRPGWASCAAAREFLGGTEVEFEAMNAIDGGEGQRRYVDAGSPMIPSLLVGGRTFPIMHPSQIASLLSLPGPMSREQLEAKFFECAELAISVEQARRAADMIWNLEKLERVGELHRILSG